MWNAAATCVRHRVTPAFLALVVVLTIAPLTRAAGGADRKAPSVPSNLHVTATTADSIAVAWDAAKDNKRATPLAGYGIYANASLIATATDTGYTLTGLSCGKTSTVGVDAVDAAGNRSDVASITASTGACPLSTSTTAPAGADTSAPTAPSALTVTATTTTSISLAWTAASDNTGVSGYSIYLGGSRVATTPTTAYSLGGLTCGTSYALAVDAYDAAGNHSPATSITTSTTACPDTTAPTVPAGLLASNSTSTSIALTWTASFDDVGVVGYGVYRGGVLTASTTLTSYTVGGLACGTSYTLAIDSFDAAGNRSARASVVATTSACAVDTTTPTAPTNLTASAITQTSVSLTWTPSTDNIGVVGYGLYRGGVRISETSRATGLFDGLSCGTTYTLGVDAVDAAGNRSSVSTVRTTTAACSVSTSEPQPLGNPGTWHLVFRDEFDGSALNTSVWTPTWFGPSDTSITKSVNWGDSAVVNCYDPANVTVHDGTLDIKSEQRTCTTWDGYKYSWASGIIDSRQRYDFTYGHMEARVWFPPDNTTPVNWGGFWANGYSWPSTGEIDVGETLPNTCFNFHYSGGQLGPTCPSLADPSGWHVVAADWEPGSLKGYYDGHLIQTWTGSAITTAPMYLLVTMDIKTTRTPTATHMLVDYIRVWQH